MEWIKQGDIVRVDIPDETDPNHEEYHGRHGTIVDTLTDVDDVVTGRETNGMVFRVEFENGEQVDLRSQDLRPPFKSEW